jgi:hypothetical protein
MAGQGPGDGMTTERNFEIQLGTEWAIPFDATDLADLELSFTLGDGVAAPLLILSTEEQPEAFDTIDNEGVVLVDPPYQTALTPQTYLYEIRALTPPDNDPQVVQFGRLMVGASIGAWPPTVQPLEDEEL